jgi:hypothetical protein
MRKLDTTLLRIEIAIWAFFAYLISTEVGLLSERFRGAGLFFRWQAWCLAGILLIVLRDVLASTRCRACNERELPTLRGLFTTGQVLCPSCVELRAGEVKPTALEITSEGLLL